MSKSKEEAKSLYDIDFDGDSWLGQKEVSLSSKLLVSVGSITTLGGLFPSFLETLSTWNKGGNDQVLFLIFSICYLVMPLLVFLVWVWVTNRVVFPKTKKDEKGGTLNLFLKQFKSSPITYRYQWIVLLHALLVTFYLIVSLYLTKSSPQVCLYSGLLLFVSPMLGLLYFTKRFYANRKITTPLLWLILLLVFGIVFIYLYGVIPNHTEQERSHDYNDLIKVNNIAKELDELEKEIDNHIERFYLKSAAQTRVTLDSIQALPNYINIDQFKIDGYLKVLGKIMLEEEIHTNEREYLVSDVLKLHHKKHSLSEGGIHHELFSLPFTQEHLNNQIRQIKDSLKGGEALFQMMRVVDDMIDSLMSKEHHRLYATCFSPIDSVDKNILLTKKQLPIYFQKNNAERFTLKRGELSALMNYWNSKSLKEWVENIYMPYCKKKAEKDIADIVKGTKWIWEDIQIRGNVISIVSLLLLLFFYLELIDLKQQKVEELKNKEEGDFQDQVKGLNEKSTYLLYPLSMALTIIAMLLIPLNTDMEFKGISPNQSFFKMNMPSLHLPEPVEQLVGGEREKDAKKDISVDVEIKEMDRLTDILNQIESSLKENNSIDTNSSVFQNLKRDIRNVNQSLDQKEKQIKRLQELSDSLAEENKKLERKVNGLQQSLPGR